MSRSKYSLIVSALRQAGIPLDIDEISRQTSLPPQAIIQKIAWSGEGLVHKVRANNRVYYFTKSLPEARSSKESRGE